MTRIFNYNYQSGVVEINCDYKIFIFYGKINEFNQYETIYRNLELLAIA